MLDVNVDLNYSGGMSVNADLTRRMDRVYDHLYANASMRTPSGICMEVGKILHAAMFIEETTGNRPTLLLSRSELKKLTQGDSALCHKVAAATRQWFAQMNEVWALYDEDQKIHLRDLDIGYVCGELNGVVVSDRNRDVFGDTLEVFRSHWMKRIGGQFFTDPRVTALAIGLLNFDPRRGDDLADICAGTGGFLLAGLNHIRKLLEADTGTESIEAQLVSLAVSSLKGQEVDREVCDIANATLGARLGVLAEPLVTEGDSLKPGAFGTDHPGGLCFGGHLCAASNPPFGTRITVKDPDVLQQFDLACKSGRSTGATRTSGEYLIPRAPDILFLEQNVRMLKPGVGRLAIVLPYQILSGPQALYVRDWLLRYTEILAVIDLPAETFQPYTGTRTSLVVVKRRKKPLTDAREAGAERVFMSMPRWIGHDRRGNPVYQRTADGRLTDQILTDFDKAEQAYAKFRRNEDPTKAHEFSFTVPYQAILMDPMLRINALFHQPLAHGEARASVLFPASVWRVMKVRDVVKRIFFPSRFKRHYVDYYPGAVPFLGGSNITQLVVKTDKWLRHDDPKLETLRVHTGWVLVTRSGSTGIVSTVPEAWDGFAMSEHVIRIIPDPEKLDPAYLQVFLRSEHGQKQLARGVFGSVIEEINPEFLGEIKIPVPRSSQLLNRIVRRVHEAERARQIAIENLVGAVEELDKGSTT